MLADMPWYDYEKSSESPGKTGHNEVCLDNMDQEGLMNLIKKING